MTASQTPAILAFGDSYFDSGASSRLSAAALAANVPGARRLPGEDASGNYAPGRWSDGPSMVEVMAARLGGSLTNYAVGGGKATYGNYHAWLDYYADSGLSGQIEGYEAALRGQRPGPATLCVVSAGANDFFQYHDYRQPGFVALVDAPRRSVASVAAKAARSVTLAVAKLAEIGAPRIVVLSSYALDATPWATLAGATELAHSYGSSFDAALELGLADIPRSAPVVIVRFDVGGQMRAILGDPVAHGIDNVRDACQPMLPVPRPRRGDGARYFWWDECHPTARVHEILGEALARRALESG